MSLWYRCHINDKKNYVFSGDGGLFTAGRWNHKGRKVVYCSENIALATLEWLSHNGLSVSGFSYNKYSIEIPNSKIKKFSLSDMPLDWIKSPSVDSTRTFADDNLFNSKEYLAIAIPSVVIPEEFNLVINPMHDDYDNIRINIKHIGTYNAPLRY